MYDVPDIAVYDVRRRSLSLSMNMVLGELSWIIEESWFTVDLRLLCPV